MTMPQAQPFIITSNDAILNSMEQHQENMLVLQEMLSVLRERQSAWDLTAKEKERSKKGIEALEAAAAALSIQIYA
jgi:hypothetical protein